MESDTVGANFKLRVEHMLLRNRDLTISTAEQLVDAYLMHCGEEGTGVFQYNIVECFPTIQRIHKDSRKEIEIKGIRKLHALYYSGSSIRATKTSCHACCEIDGDCGQCREDGVTVPESKVVKCMAGYLAHQEEQGEGEEDWWPQEGESVEMDEAEEENDEAEEDLQQIEQSDAEEKEGEEEEEEGLDDDLACVNCPVWALRYRKRLPAVICDIQQIPIEP